MDKQASSFLNIGIMHNLQCKATLAPSQERKWPLLSQRRVPDPVIVPTPRARTDGNAHWTSLQERITTEGGMHSAAVHPRQELYFLRAHTLPPTTQLISGAQHKHRHTRSHPASPRSVRGATRSHTTHATYKRSSNSEMGGMVSLRPLRLRASSTIAITFSSVYGSPFITSQWWKNICGKAWPEVSWRRKALKPKDSATGRYAFTAYIGVPGRFCSSTTVPRLRLMDE
mmetsp:Transcript_6929/g.16121  ORF Transcript_6929/g.16121 Transcript_6929/m.16121 type:complete len:228 (-) Transcript_6929:2323-3006(-)